jgi:hypothetical protein
MRGVPEPSANLASKIVAVSPIPEGTVNRHLGDRTVFVEHKWASANDSTHPYSDGLLFARTTPQRTLSRIGYTPGFILPERGNIQFGHRLWQMTASLGMGLLGRFRTASLMRWPRCQRGAGGCLGACSMDGSEGGWCCAPSRDRRRRILT